MGILKFDEKDNCGVGVIANINGIPLHEILTKGIAALIKLSHRGAVQSDGRTGDGCGVLIQIPDEYFRFILLGKFELASEYAAGNVFFSKDHLFIQKDIIVEECKKLGFVDIYFRTVLINVSVLGKIAKNSQPIIEQLFINKPEEISTVEFNLLLFVLRKNIEFRLKDNKSFFICSLSSKTIIYKALCLPRILKEFYLDLNDPLLKTNMCVFHQRFSTNTEPSWHLAQPFRYVAHNGEINTVSANREWIKSRGFELLPVQVKQKLNKCANMVCDSGSDSFSLDNMVELLLISGVDFKQALRILVPPFWENNDKLSPEIQKWYESVSIGYEPWDGPAGIVYSNGSQIMSCLDRNGLRPLRYSITQNGFVVIASETGVIDYPSDEFVVKNRLGAGEMILIDLQCGKIFLDKEIYQKYDLKIINQNRYTEIAVNKLTKKYEHKTTDINIYKKMFLISKEEIENVLKIASEDGVEATMSMGDDTAIAVLSQKIRPLTDYFRQCFAQVTNPAIDSIREKYVMSLDTYIGNKPDLISDTTFYGYKLKSPLLSPEVFAFFEDGNPHEWKKSYKLDINFDSKVETLEDAVRRITEFALQKVKEGINILILSDDSIYENLITIPSILLVGSIHNNLIKSNLRLNVDLIVATGSARDPHQICVLLSFGANAVFPYLSFRILEELSGGNNEIFASKIKNYLNAMNKGILKIMSKMGISTLQSYRGSQLFEALGIDDEVTDYCFPGVVTRIKGDNFKTIQEKLVKISATTWNSGIPIEPGGNLKYAYFGEYHAFNPDVVTKLQTMARSNLDSDYLNFANEVNNRPLSYLRDLLKLRLPVDVNKNSSNLDPIDEICKSFDCAAMSIGALGKEAHEALAIAMNTIGGRSNSGEGGEDPKRFGTIRNSKIKQIASGRFGVTPSYLMSAEIIQIKISQGAKPGEGGQLPGEKVSAEIAWLRHATEGITLISPPPHHDIYSIEDLAQLIFDLKQLNPGARISVKLVSNAGIGVIACGVAKAQADLITISGYDGGTGAAPITSVKNAGIPWELGISETHKALVQNNLRHKIRLQVDGGLKTGVDVIKAAILGAETFGFGTAPMVALGCKYLRICHLNNCATGLATQNIELREKHFKGLPDMVINYFRGLATEVQQIMLSLGVSKLVDLIGRVDLLERCSEFENIDLSGILLMSGVTSKYPLYYSENSIGHDRGVLNQRVYADCMDAVQNCYTMVKNYSIYNTDRSVGATLAGEIAKNYGVNGIGYKITLNFTGTAGQSFGVWAVNGMELRLNGEANDYVGKGLAGGTIIIQQNNKNIDGLVTVMGNTCLYGATSGKLFANGGAGDRFAARNSGVTAVIEGIACNGCEYMTGGVVMVLGTIDQNFGAGMTGGVCYVFGKKEQIEININHDFVEAVMLDDLGETANIHKSYILNLVNKHLELTKSFIAQKFLQNDGIEEVVVIKPKSVGKSGLLNFLDKDLK